MRTEQEERRERIIAEMIDDLEFYRRYAAIFQNLHDRLSWFSFRTKLKCKGAIGVLNSLSASIVAALPESEKNRAPENTREHKI